MGEIGMKKLVLVRHAQSMSNAGKDIVDYDKGNPLSPYGEQQANMTRELLKTTHFDKVFCSPLYRAIQTASIITEDRPDITIAEQLKERFFGAQWETVYANEHHNIRKYWTEKEILDLNSDPLWKITPDCESQYDVYKRVVDYYLTVIHPERKNNDILIVSHFWVIKAIIAYLEDVSLYEMTDYKILNAVPYIYHTT